MAPRRVSVALGTGKVLVPPPGWQCKEGKEFASVVSLGLCFCFLLIFVVVSASRSCFSVIFGINGNTPSTSMFIILA